MVTPNMCVVCGEPMPNGEEMFLFHGYSGPCPKPPLTPKPAIRIEYDEESGLHHVLVFLGGEWLSISAECNETEAKQNVEILIRWKQA